MRDIAITVFILAFLPKVLKFPWVGALLFVLVSVMTPHQFGYSFAPAAPFAAAVAAATMFSMLMHRDQVDYRLDLPMVLLLAFPLWMCVTYAFAFEQEAGYDRWVEVMKIFFMLHVASSVIRTRKHVEMLVWVLVVAVGFYGVKGGLFTLLTGGSSRVYGPPGKTFMSDNNAVSVALVMVIPLMGYLRSLSTKPWQRHAAIVAMGLSFMAILGSQSRGALLAVLSMVLMLWFKSRKKLQLMLVLLLLVPVGIGFMPDSWTERMHTIKSYEQDTSAMGRINAWQNAINIANDRPLVGGGFELYSIQVFAKYAPDPLDVHAAHSVYFQILGEHGYVGLLIYLSIIGVTWVRSRRIIKRCDGDPELDWAARLMRALQISLVGFSVGGAFVNIGYWEILYYEVLMVVVVYRIVFSPQPRPALQPTAA